MGGLTLAGRTGEYFTDILLEPRALGDKCEERVRRAWDYFKMSYQQKLDYWTHNTKPARWPQLLAALSYAEVRSVFFTLIGRGPTRLGSHWSRANTMLGQQFYASSFIQSPLLGALPFCWFFTA